MPRPRKSRRVCALPRRNRFGPLDGFDDDTTINMTVDEYDTIRLIDLEGLTQEECARQMNVARTTVQSIYMEARRKLAQSLVNGWPMVIEGGVYTLCDDADFCGKHCRRRRRHD